MPIPITSPYDFCQSNLDASCSNTDVGCQVGQQFVGCIDIHKVCDLINDCPEGEDESNCTVTYGKYDNYSI